MMYGCSEGGDGSKISKKDFMKEAEAKLAAFSLKPAKPRMVPNVPAGKIGGPFPVQTNAFLVNIKKAMSFWRYDIAIFAQFNNRTVFFTKKSNNDYVVTNRNYKCKVIFDAVLSKYKEFFGDSGKLWYDGQCILFSATDLFKNENETLKKFEVSGHDCRDKSLSVFQTIVFQIAAVEENYCVTLSDKTLIEKSCNLDLSRNDHSLIQLMEIIFNQVAVMNPKQHALLENGKAFLSQPWMYGFSEKDCPTVGDGKRLYPGTKKSVHIIEGPGGRGSGIPAILIDSSKAAFHEEMLLIEKAKIIVNSNFSKKISELDLEKLNAGLKGVYFYTRYTGLENDHKIAAIVNHSASDTTFSLQDGSQVTVLQYFADRYKINLQYPNAPLVKASGGSQNYPMELCFIRPMQRVTPSQRTTDESHKTTRQCAIPPGERQDNIVKGATALKLFGSDGNAFVENAGLSINKVPLEVQGRLLHPPQIRYSNSVATVSDGKWRIGQEHFFKTIRCEVWAIYAIITRNEKQRFNEKLLWDFGKLFLNQASHRGIMFTRPRKIAVTTSESELEDCLRESAHKGCEFCLIISSDSITSAHKKVKLWERELELTTQDVRMSTVLKIVKERRMLSMENIIAKTNMKLGGLNYVLDLNGICASDSVKNWMRPGRLFLGISMSHPSPSGNCSSDKDVPSVIGYAANFKENTFDFVGDYIFQSPRRDEIFNTMSEILSIIIPKFAENHDGKCPRDLVIYRSGLPEGSFSTVLTHEIPLLRGTLTAMGIKNIKIIFIVVQKTHNVRLMMRNIDRARKPSEQNIPSGVVVDSQLTHPNFKEFFLNSHVTLQGTSRTPRYTVLVDDFNLSMDELEGMTYVLTYGHQIVNLPTSLPTPLYVASCYADRGRNNYEAHMILSDSTSSESGASVDYGRLACRLSYNSTKLANFRVNA